MVKRYTNKFLNYVICLKTCCCLFKIKFWKIKKKIQSCRHVFFCAENTGVDASLSKILKKTFLNDKEDKTSHSDIKHSEKNLSKTDYFTALEYNMNKSCMGHALIINNEHFDDRLGLFMLICIYIFSLIFDKFWTFYSLSILLAVFKFLIRIFSSKLFFFFTVYQLF